MYQIIAIHRITGDILEDIKGIQSFTIAKKIGLLLSSHDLLITMNLCDAETGKVIKSIDIFKDW
jgi:hypothetical protein